MPHERLIGLGIDASPGGKVYLNEFCVRVSRDISRTLKDDHWTHLDHSDPVKKKRVSFHGIALLPLLLQWYFLIAGRYLRLSSHESTLPWESKCGYFSRGIPDLARNAQCALNNRDAILNEIKLLRRSWPLKKKEENASNEEEEWVVRFTEA